jgi:hypothetical protein
MPDSRAHERDRWLRRVNQITGATLAGGVVLTAGWSAVAAHTSAGTPTAPPSQVVVDEGGTQQPATGDATTVPAPAPDQAPAATTGTQPEPQPPQQQVTPATAPPITSARHHRDHSGPVSGGT